MEIVCLQKGRDATPLYCMPTASGSVSSYLELARVVGHDRSVFGIRTVERVHTGRLRQFASLRETATCIAGKLLVQDHHGPSYLIGYSFGAHVAIEVARELVRQGKPTPLVAIIDQPPSRASFTLLFRVRHFVSHIGPKLIRVANRIATDPEQRLNYGKAFLRKLKGQRSLESESWFEDLPKDRKDYIKKSLANGRNYRFEGSYPGRILLLRPKPSAAMRLDLLRPRELDDYGWRRVTGATVHVVYLPGDHGSLMGRPDVVHLGNQLSVALNDCDRQALPQP